MASEWENVTIGEIATLQRGFDISKNEQRPGSVPVISSGGIGSYHDEAKRDGPGVTMGRKGTLGSVYWVDRPYWPHSTSLWVKDFHGNDPKFVYYFFKAMGPELLRMDVGAANPTLNRNHVHPLPALRPPLLAQRAIAHVLGTLDDLIELNRETNEILEEMARALFKSWFVDFDPVRAKLEGRPPAGMDAATAALFPDHFQDSELGQIPKGWEVGRLEAIANVGSGKRPEGRRDVSSHDCKIPLYGGGGCMGYVSSSLYDFPILFTGRVGTLGVIFRTSEPSWPSDNTLIVEPQTGLFDFTYFVLKGFDLINLNRGSTQPLLTQTDLKRQMLIIPTKGIVKAFADFAEPMFQQMVANEGESRDLATLRDTLLPKLLSGEVKAPAAKEVAHE